MNIKEIRALRGANYYSKHPVVFMKLDIGDLEKKPTDLVEGFQEKINQMMPSLAEHYCSPGKVGGFYERLRSGTWAGHVVEHVALELQCLAGHEVTFGKTFGTEEVGVYDVVYRYKDEMIGLRAGEMSVMLVEKLFQGITTDVQPLIIELKELAETSLLGPSTQSIVDEATKRGISFLRLNEHSYVQLGQGVYQRRIQATMMDRTSALGVEIADDKESAKNLLKGMGIPVPQGASVESFQEAQEEALKIGYPVVVKPLVGNHGRGVTVRVVDEVELKKAYTMAKKICHRVLVEKHLEGLDYRILVIDGKFVAAALREPAQILGDGKSTISALIEEINKSPERGIGHEKNLTRIKVDDMMEELLAVKGLSLASVPKEQERIYIKTTANISAGGTAEDVTEIVHPLNQLMAERMAKIIGLDVIGIDIIAKTLSEPLKEGRAGIVEVNAAPGFRMHLHPTKGKPRNVAKNVLDMLFPPWTNHEIPIVAVTGTNGKTTTTRLIAHILGLNGSVVGMTSTDAVIIDNIPIISGDYSGPEGARKVMMDATVDLAVFEVARGGILRRGLGYGESDVGILLNISADHMGDGGIDSLEKLTRLKSTVTEMVKENGYAVYNADDPLVLSCMKKGSGHRILFSKNPEHKALQENYEAGNMNVTVDKGKVMIQRKEWTSVVASIMEIPITFEGRALFNVENVLAAVAATAALGLNETQIRAGLVSFSPSIGQSPGRMNIIDMDGFKVLIDYGHNVGAVNATAQFVKGLMPGRKIRMASGVGNRRREDLLEFGETLSRYYDHIVLCDADPRERPKGETAQILREGLLKGGFLPEMITVVLDEVEATKVALNMARRGDLVILQADNIEQVIENVIAHKNRNGKVLMNK